MTLRTPMSPRPRHEPQFTLIELLAVIGIIALLLAMLLPTLGLVREKARKNACLGNLRQIGVAVNCYVTDNKSFLPVCKRIGDSPDDPACIVNALELASEKTFMCPSDTEPYKDGKTFHELYRTSYEWNAWLSGRMIDRSEIGVAQMRIWAPLAGDGASFHKKLGRNYLYADGSVKPSLELLITDE